MDWQAAIGRHHTALRRVVAVLVAMVGAGADPKADAAALAIDRPTLARHRHRALLALVRPAEAAARRLVIVLALALAEAPAPAHAAFEAAPPHRRKRRHFQPWQPVPTSAILLGGIGTGIVLPRDMRIAAVLAKPRTPPRVLRLPLTDPLRRVRARRVPVRALPRIWAPGCAVPFRPPLPPSPMPDDRLDATRLVLRVGALAAALDDLPRETARFRRWQTRHLAAIAEDRRAEEAALSGPKTVAFPRATGNRRRFRRVSPLRSGRPPGARRRTIHEVHAILDDLHSLAFEVLERPDTS
ncbi:MAG: hypothetical protein ACK4U0_16970 [Mesorhizobium sp.]